MTTSTTSMAPDDLVAVQGCPACGRPPPDDLLFSGLDRLVGNPGRWGVARCRWCGLAFTTPRVPPERMDDYYPPSYPSFQRRGTGPRRARGAAAAFLNRARLEVSVRRGPYRQFLRGQPGRLLDVGCGGGVLGEFFLRRGWEVYGIEPSEHGSARAAARGLQVHRGTLEDAPWPPGSFDAAIFNHSLEHMPQPGQAVMQAARLLKRGGLVAVSVPNFGCWQRRVFRDRWFQLDVPRHLQHFERDTLSRLLAGAGLELDEMRTQSMLAGLSGSVQYALFERFVLRGATAVAATYASLPLLAALDLAGQGDCLGAVAHR
jgi:SAM-dependent methyltransferase